MRPSFRRPSPSFAAAALLALLVLGPPHAAATPAPHLDRIIVIVMENKTYDQVRTQPYTAGLIAAGSSFSSSFGVTHPSQPNYLALWAGSTLSVTNDNCPPFGSPYSAENLGHACEAAGRTWKAYSEDLPSAGSSVCTANGSLYTRKHDPWTDFSNLNHLNERPYTDLALDRAAGTLPNLAFVIPNNCDNSHNTGCTAAFADSWLAANVPAMLDSLGPNGMLVLTWDEDDFSASNHILTVFVGPKVRAGYVSPTHVTHYTVLRTLCETLGLAPFGAAASEPSIGDVWIPDTTPPTVAVTAPNGGETWKVGSTHTIAWTATDDVGVTGVDLDYSTDGGASYPHPIASGLGNTGSYAWTVPDAPGGVVRVRATARDAAGNAGEDASDADFAIDTYVIAASAGPNGSITPVGAIAVAYGGTRGFTIAASPGYRIADVVVDGSSAGAVPTYAFANVTADHSIAASFADSSAPAVQVIAPNGGETLIIGAVTPLQWSATDTAGVAAVDLLLSRSGAAGPCDTLALGVANTGSYPWTVTGPPTADAFLKVVARDSTGNAAQDSSDAAFSITGDAAADEGPIQGFALERVWPNPMREVVRVRFAVPRATRVRLDILDLEGREVARLFDQAAVPGRHVLEWRAHARRGPAPPPGLYWVRLIAPENTFVRRLAIVR